MLHGPSAIIRPPGRNPSDSVTSTSNRPSHVICTLTLRCDPFCALVAAYCTSQKIYEPGSFFFLSQAVCDIHYQRLDDTTKIHHMHRASISQGHPLTSNLFPIITSLLVRHNAVPFSLTRPLLLIPATPSGSPTTCLFFCFFAPFFSPVP